MPIRPEVESAVRKAVMLSYVYSARQMTIEELADTLNEPTITPETLARWADADNWDGLRAQKRTPQENATDRVDSCARSLQALHNRALRLQRSLRPKSWESAAMVQMRCAESLRAWSAEEAKAGDQAALAEQAAVRPDVPTTAWEGISDQEWQAMAHAALSGFKKPREDGDEQAEEAVVN